MDNPTTRLEIARIRSRDDLPSPPFPQQPEVASSKIPTKAKIKLIQAYITSLEYNYTGEAFFTKKKDRGFRHVTSTAKLIIRDALPIQCVEAVYLGAFFTANMSQIDRFPVCFRSSLDGRVFRHIVLAVRSGVTWGALGLSRRATLMYKELRYPSFSKLIADFRESYAGSWHHLEQVWVGFPLPHDISSNIPVKWKVMRASVGTDEEWTSAANDLDRFVLCAPAMFEHFASTGKLPDHPLLSGSLASATADGDEGDRSVAAKGDGYDPRRSPGAGSPGTTSPGALPYWLGPGVSARRRCRASTAIGRSVTNTSNSVGDKGTLLGRSLLEKCDASKDGIRCVSGPGSCGSGMFVSPPRVRARTSGTGVDEGPHREALRIAVDGKSNAED